MALLLNFKTFVWGSIWFRCSLMIEKTIPVAVLQSGSSNGADLQSRMHQTILHVVVHPCSNIGWEESQEMVNV